jgi:hypothetical protein
MNDEDRYGEPVSYAEQSGIKPDDNLVKLKEAIMLASPPHPGYSLEGIVVFTMWEADDGSHRRGDGLIYPDGDKDELMVCVETVLQTRRDAGF